MNKKGFLLAEETLKIILALISISFLVYFLTALYFVNQDSKELEQAEASLEFLIKEINSGRTEVEIYNPAPSINTLGIFRGWKITSWSSNEMPNQCSSFGWDNCVCICKTDLLENNKEECNEEGICRENEFTVEGGVIEIAEVPLTLNIEYGDEITITKK